MHLTASMGSEPPFATVALATLHCLIGCALGEVTGLVIGVGLGLGAVRTIALAVVLAFVFGLGLAAHSVMRREGLGFGRAFRAIWLGEVISIAAMEVAMNVMAASLGGASAHSLSAPVFWWSLAAAIPAGYAAAFPVNFVLIKRQLKHCH